MGKVKVHGGDFPIEGSHRFEGNNFYFQKGWWLPFSQKVPGADIEELQQIYEDNKVKVAGAAGWGLAGGVALGPAGALAGMLLGGRGKKVVFACIFQDGRRLLGETDIKTWTAIMAASFNRRGPVSKRPPLKRDSPDLWERTGRGIHDELPDDRALNDTALPPGTTSVERRRKGVAGRFCAVVAALIVLWIITANSPNPATKQEASKPEGAPSRLAEVAAEPGPVRKEARKEASNPENAPSPPPHIGAGFGPVRGQAQPQAVNLDALSQPDDLCTILDGMLPGVRHRWSASRSTEGGYVCSPHGTAREVGPPGRLGPTILNGYVYGGGRQKLDRFTLKLNIFNLATADVGKTDLLQVAGQVANTLQISLPPSVRIMVQAQRPEIRERWPTGPARLLLREMVGPTVVEVARDQGRITSVLVHFRNPAASGLWE